MTGRKPLKSFRRYRCLPPPRPQKKKPRHRFAKDQLKAIIERIERLEEEKKTTSDDIRDVYAEAKGTGFDIKALRTIVRMRKQDTDERREEQAVLEMYMNALGMLQVGNVCFARESEKCGAVVPARPLSVLGREVTAGLAISGDSEKRSSAGVSSKRPAARSAFPRWTIHTVIPRPIFVIVLSKLNSFLSIFPELNFCRIFVDRPRFWRTSASCRKPGVRRQPFQTRSASS